MAVIDRRGFLQVGVAALAGAASGVGVAQSGSGAPAPAAATPANKIRIDAYSRTLHWLRTPDEVAEACHQIGNSTIDLTVRAYPGHVDPAKVTTDLPVFFKGLAKHGITVTNLAADITDSKTPYVEEMLGTASSLGIRYNWWRGFNLDSSKPYPPQFEALKPRLEALVKLQEKNGMKAMYHPQGGPMFDQLELIRSYDPRYVSLHYDTSHWLQVSNSNMAAMIMLAGPYVGGFVWKDGIVEKRDPAAMAAAAAGRGPRPAGDGAGAPAGSAGPGAEGTGQGGGGRGNRGGAAGGAQAEGGNPGGGRGPGGGFGGGGGRGGSYNGWGTAQVPVGTGMVDFTVAARALKAIHFDGPTECQPEWAGLGGAENGRDTLTLPRETVIALLKHDYDTIYASLTAGGLA